MGQWFEEQLEVPLGRIFKFEYRSVLETTRSAFQRIAVYDSVSFGKILVHDDVIMLTEKDEANYHEMIAHVPLFTHPHPESVLVVGGGDGGTMREVLRHSEVKTAHLCEIDEEVVHVCRRHFPSLTSSFDDPRVELFFEDGAEFIKKRRHQYDVIIVDSSDPVGPAEVLYRREFYQSLAAALKDDGIVVTQSESIHYHGNVIGKLASFCKDTYPLYRYYFTLVPTYPSGLIGFSFCSKKYDPLGDFDEKRARKLSGLRYYHSDIHRSSFVLPAFTRDFL